MISVAVCDDDKKLLQWMERELQLFSERRNVALCQASVNRLLERPSVPGIL